MSNLLFICSKNQWRSPTAEGLFKNHPFHKAASAGTSHKARICVSQKIIDRADIIFTMEWKHREMLKQRFNIQGKQLIVLDIEDKYQFNDPGLIAILQQALYEYL